MKVLYVEDDARDADLARREFARLSPHFSLELARGLGEARERLGEGTAHDIVLADLNLRDGSGLELLMEIRARALPVAAVVLTGSESGETAVAAFKAGADDFVLKTNGYLTRLAGVLVAALDRFRAEGARQERPVRVLYAEDSAIDADLTRQHLARHAPNIRLEVVQGVPELLQRLPRAAGEPSPCDVLLLDYRLAGADALEALRMLREERHLYLPVVLVTGHGDGDVAARAFRYGAANYVIKRPGYLSELPAVLESAYDRAQLVRDIAERKLAEEGLRQSEQRYRELVSAVPGAVYSFRVDAEGRRSFPFVSEGIGALAGLSPAEVMADARIAFQTVPAEAMPALEQSIGASLQQLSPWMHEFPIRTASGEDKWLRGQSLPRREAGGATVWHGVFIDITARKRAEEALRSSEANLRAITENATAGITIFQDGRRVFANRGAADLLGYTVEEFLPLALGDVIHPDSLDLVLDRHRRRAAGEAVPSRYEFTALAKDGHAVPVEGTYANTVWNGRPAIMAFVTDITERRRAEQSLRDSEARFRAAFDQAAVGMGRREFDGRWLDVNEKFCDILGYTREELLRLTSVEITVPEERQRTLEFNERLRRGELSTYSREKQYLRKDGTPVWVNLSINVVNGADGRPGHIVAAIEDISQRKQAERKLRKRGEQLRLLTENIPAAIAYFDQDQVIQVANQHYAKLYRGAGVEMVGLHARNVVGEKDWPQVAKHNARVFAGEPAVFERTHERPDGERREIEVHLEPDRAAGGEVRGYYSFILDITGRKRAEEALRDSEAQMRLIAENLPAMIMHFGHDYRVHYANRRYAEFFVGPERDIEGWHLRRVVGNESWAKVEGQLVRVLSGEQVAYEREALRADGEPRSLAFNIVPRRGASGEILGAYTLGFDVTERKRAEKKLRKRDAQLRLLTDNIPAAVAYIDRDLLIQVANQRYVELFCGAGVEVIGRHVRDVVDKKAWPDVAKHIARVFAGESFTFQRTLECPDGARREIEVHFEPDHSPGGEVRGYYAFVLDITERERTRAALRESEVRFRATFEQAAVGVAHVGTDGRWLRVNQRLCDIAGYTREELLARTFQDITHPDDLDADLDHLRRTLAGEMPTFSMEKRYVRKDGGFVWINLTVALVRKDSGEPDYLISVIEDITVRKSAEEALRESEARFRDLSELSSDWYWEQDENCRFVDVKDSSARLSPLRAANYVGYTRWEAYAECLAPEQWAAHRRQVEAHEPFRDLEYPRPSQDGHLRWVSTSGQPIFDREGRFKGYRGIGKEITGRKLAEDNLRRFRAAIDASADLVLLIDPATMRYVDVNETACRALGYSREELLAMGPQDIFSVPRETMAGIYRRLIAGDLRESAAEGRYRRKDGSPLWVESFRRAVPFANGHAIVAVARDITERRRAEEALRESEARFRNLTELSSDFYWEQDEQFRFVERIGAIHEQQGFYPLSQGIGKTRWEIPSLNMTEADWAKHREDLEAHREFRDLVIERPGEAGFPRFISTSGQPIFDREGCFKGYRGVGTDITERTTTENALRLLSTGMAHLSGEAFFNEVASRAAEYLEAEIGFVNRLQAPANTRIRTLGLCIDRQAMPPVEFDLAHTPCEAVIGKQPVVLPEQVRQLFPAFRMAADLGVSGYAAVPLFDAHGMPIGAVGVMSRAPLRQPADRIEALLRLFAVRTAAEIERLGAEARFKNLFEFSADACVIVNQAGIITAMNQGARSLFGYSHEELVGLPVDILVPETLRKEHAGMRRNFHTAAASRPMGSGRANLHARRKDGTTFPADIDLHPLQTDDGVAVVATVHDMTARRQDEERHRALEAQLRQSQKMEAVGTLAGGIAHDFNNIIGAILGNAALAREDVGPGHAARHSIEEIDKAGRRARDLVQQILAFSRKQALSRSVIALGPVVEEAVRLLHATLPAGVRLTTDCAPGAPNIMADPTQIHQVLVNLCTNAWHAMEGEPGQIDIRLEEVAVDAAMAREHANLRPGKCVRLSVADTGKGMDAATKERIFEPFFTTKAIDKGTGLGLSVVHGIVQGHGGAIVVDSAPRQGTTFQLYFPALDAAATVHPATAAVFPMTQGRQQHVLYLDDDEALVSLVSRMLARQGYRVSGYTLAWEALDAVRAAPDGFDLVVTDFNMPGMSGLDVAREIALIRPGLPVAVTSGYITDELREKAPASGVRHLIYKPDTADELCAVVRRLTGQADSEDPRRA